MPGDELRAGWSIDALAGRYRAGEELLFSLSAPGWRPERIMMRFRWGRPPLIRLIRR